MEKGLKLHKFKRILCGSFGIRKKSRKVLFCASIGFIGIVIVLVSMLGYQNTPVASKDVVRIAAETNSFAIPVRSAGSAISPPPGSSPSPPSTLQPVDFDGLIEFYQLTADHYYNDYGYSSNHYAYTDEELNMLAKVIYGEAHGEPSKGKIAVGNVVMNRVLARGYPGKTIKAVITAPGQFTGYSASIKPNSACISAARQVLDWEVWVIPQDVYFFHASSDPDDKGNWGTHKYCTRIGAHVFYTENYGGRNRNGKIPPALYERVYKWPQYGCEPGKRVYRLQYMLNKLGYDLNADSYFGKDTKEAIVSFQAKNRLKADGVAGPATILALIKAFGPNEYIAKFGG
ncbi:MAG TPA: cell wall hydrolase [Clostridia bacterium]|nr:cell wall hydrolase [Clostridia bacterium]